MKEHPILFSGPMVRAIIEGRKTQMRRIVKPQPPEWAAYSSTAMSPDDLFCHWTDGATEDYACWPNDEPLRCPYGRVGDRLWVREAWGLWDRYMTRQESVESGIPSAAHALDANNAPKYWKKRVIFRSDGEPDPCNTWHWHPSIHMPRWASRLTLEITDIRVQRLLQAISEEDARAEGMESCTPYDQFRALWDSINGKRASWQSNPWVWVLSFQVVHA